ncbi:MAG: hypothetical protein WCS52_17330 [bacterium]
MNVNSRVRTFWEAGLEDGPLVSIWLPEPPADLKRWDLASQVAYWENRRHLPDDTAPHVAISNEAETMAALLGVPVEYSAGSAWSTPILSNLAEGLKVRFDPGAPLYQELIRRIEAAKGRPEYALKMIPVAGISDLLSALRGAQDLMMDLMEDPDSVAVLVAHVAGCWRYLMRDLLGRLPLYEGGLVGGLAWMPGRGATVSADMMMMCSPDWFHDLIWPEERKLLNEFDSVIYHLHSGGSGPALAEWIAPHPRVKAVEISHDPTGPDLESLEPVLAGIQEHTRLLVTCWSRRFTDAELAWMARHLDRRHLSLFQYADTPEEGQSFLDRVHTKFA